MSSVTTPRGRIIIVDDDQVTVRLGAHFLREKGFEVKTAISGERALELLSSWAPDLVLLDIMMDGIDGFETCRRLHEATAEEPVPVMFMTALDDPEAKVTAFAAGAVDYVTKPVQPAELLARVTTHVKLRLLRRDLARQNKQLKLEIDEKIRLVEELDAFAHTVAHDLKTPLTSLVGFTSLLADELEGDGATEVQRELAETIQRNARRMTNIVEEVLLLGEMRARDAELQPLDLGALVTEAVDRLSFQIREKAATIEVPESWPMAAGYAPWVVEVWVNYLSNAIKYGGRPPSIRVDASAGPDGATRCSVRDNGDGVAPERRAELFRPFSRLDQVRASGHGVGLSVVARIVGRLGGRVGVESSGLQGGGSDFWFTLPTRATIDLRPVTPSRDRS